MNYQALYNKSISEPETFWKTQANQLDWFQFPTKILGKDQYDYPQWFEDGQLNLSYLCIDKHINDGFGEQIALIYDSPVSQTKENITFNKLHQEVSKLAGGLKELGLSKGDTCIIYMPMIPQAIYSMLACVRIGVIHSVVFGGFAPHELAIRISDCDAKTILTASYGIEIDKIIPYKPFVDEAIEKLDKKPKHVVVFNRNKEEILDQKKYDIDYQNLVDRSESIDAIPIESTHPSYVLYTSGTTGTPKGIIRDTGGYATALKFSMKYIYGVEEGDVFWAASDVGWVVGHSFITYGPLLNRNTTVIFEGKPVRTPDASTFWRIIDEHKVNAMFTAPTAIRALKKEDQNGDFIKQYDLRSLKHLFLAGERCDIATLNWTKEKLNIPVIDHWWQTESGWPMIAVMTGIPMEETKPGSAGLPVCGYDIRIIDEAGLEVKAGSEGYVVVKLPLPPGTLSNIWGNPTRFKSGYLDHFQGYYFSGDGGYKDESGYVYITGRVDDVINVAGHRLSTAEMEEIVSSHQAVAECAVFGVNCVLKGQKPLGLIVLKSDSSNDETKIQQEIIQLVRAEIGAVASFRDVLVVNRLPKTRSGKILRKLLRDMADEENYKVPSTIDDSTIIAEIETVYVKNRIGIFEK